MADENLKKTLIAFAKTILQKAYAFQENRRISKIAYQRIPVHGVNYDDNSFKYDFERAEHFHIWKWKSSDFAIFTSNELEASPEYQKAIDDYILAFSHPPDGATLAMHVFYRYFIDRATEDICPDANIERYVDAFIKDCGSDFKTEHWTIELWLGNAYIESDKIELAPNVFMRRAKTAELALVVQHPHYFEELDLIASHVVPSTVVLSFPIITDRDKLLEPGNVVISSEIEQWLNVLRLFKPSTLYPVRQVTKQHTVFGYQITESKDLPGEKFLEGKVSFKDKSVHTLELKSGEEQALKSFVARVKPALNQTFLTTYLSGSPLDLALHRYTDALIKSEVSAYKILSSIISFETLLSDETSELTFRISLRAASILAYYGFSGKDVFERMKKAYNLRSRLVHGGSLNKGSFLEFAETNCYHIINYNRICLLTFLLLQKTISRKDLLAMIDTSLIDDSAKSTLAHLITTIIPES